MIAGEKSQLKKRKGEVDRENSQKNNKGRKDKNHGFNVSRYN